MFETLAGASVVAIVGALWRLSVEHAGMRVTLEQGMEQVIQQIRGMRIELRRDIERAENILEDHEDRLRRLEHDK